MKVILSMSITMMTLYTFTCWSIISMNSVLCAPISLGNFRSRQHQLQGTVTLLSESVIEITGFIYDGTAPGAYFWIDTKSTPNSSGKRLLDAIPTNTSSCGKERLPRAQGVKYVVEFPEGMTIKSFLGGSISVWCEDFNANFGEVVIPTTLTGLESTANGPDLLCTKAVEFSLGPLKTRAHRVAGQVVAVSERVLEIRGFIFDGQAPAVFFWVDINPTPSIGGLTMQDGAPSNGCGLRALQAADGSKTYQVEFPVGKSIRDYLGGSISVWCTEFAANFGEVVIPPSLPSVPSTENGPPVQCSAIPEISKTPSGFNCEPLNDLYQVRWAIMGREIAIELVGQVEDTQWMGFGVSGSTTGTFMIGADPTVVDRYNGTYRARDFYLNNRSQCSGLSGVCPDSKNGTDDVKPGSVRGEREQGITLVRYVRPLIPTDIDNGAPSNRRIDRAINVTLGVETFIVWAIGPVSPETGLPQFHTMYPQGVDFKVQFGRTVTDNCKPLVGISELPTTSAVPFDIPILKDTTKIVARIGPSGGDRGYSAITNTISWGIAWYLNDLLIPVVELRRGTTYTFMISGGNTPDSNSEYHPMYLTTSASGGYAQLSPAERATQTVLAGIEVTEADASGNVMRFKSTLEAPICLYEVTDSTFALPDSGADFEDYFKTLDTSCARDSTISNSAAVLEFTPNENTPDLIYYQCITHRNLGWKINVLDAASSNDCVDCNVLFFSGELMHRRTLFGGCRQQCLPKFLSFLLRLIGFQCGACPT